jgi:hypothetical protein
MANWTRWAGLAVLILGGGCKTHDSPSGQGATVVAQVAQSKGIACGAPFAVDGPNLYYAEGSRILRIPSTGGETTLFATDTETVIGIAITGQGGNRAIVWATTAAVRWTDDAGVAPRTIGTPGPPEDAPSAGTGGALATGTNGRVYSAERGSASAPQCAYFSVAVDGTPARPVTIPTCGTFLPDATGFDVLEQPSGVLVDVGVSATAPQPLEGVSRATAFTTTPAGIYWATRATQPGTPFVFGLDRASVGTNAPRVLATSTTEQSTFGQEVFIDAMTADDRDVYFTNYGSIYRAPVAGGPMQQLIPDDPGFIIDRLGVDGEALYWAACTLPNLGEPSRIMRLAK